MEVIKKITILAVLVASSAMFSFAYGQVHEAECISKTETLEAFNHCVKTFEEQRELCSEVKETAEKYQRLFMNEPNINKQTEYSTRMNAQVNFYQTFCKDLSHLFN